MKLTLPFPPSVNTYWRHTQAGTKISAGGRIFRTNAIASLYEHLRCRPKPIATPVAVHVVLYPPTRQSRDLDNYQKALFDALTHAGVWIDDSQIKRMLVEWGPVTRGGKAEITIDHFKEAS